MALLERVGVEMLYTRPKGLGVDELVPRLGNCLISLATRHQLGGYAPHLEKAMVVVDELAIVGHDDDRISRRFGDRLEEVALELGPGG